MTLQRRPIGRRYEGRVGHHEGHPWTEPQAAILAARFERLRDAYGIGLAMVRVDGGDLVLTVDNLTEQQQAVIYRWISGESYLLDD